MEKPNLTCNWMSK